jgi:cytoskeletal protein CcmA (bactofilin family)
MTNLFPNLTSPPKKITGAATIIITIILLVTITGIILFAANYSLLQQKITSNQYRNMQAYEAAEAGLEFGIAYLQKNPTLRATIIANPVNGFITPYSNSSTTNIALPNNSKYTVVYTNPVANNYTLLQVTATGVSDDSNATRVVSQQIKFTSFLQSPPTRSLTAQGSVSISGNSVLKNTESNKTITSASGVTFSGNGTAVGSQTTSSAGNIKADVTQNDSTLQNLTSAQFLNSFFGADATTIKNSANYYYNNSTNTNYSSSLNNVSNAVIWIDQTNGSSAILSGNTVLGTAANPVLLIVNGDLNISGSITVYGLIIVLGSAAATTDINGNVAITGGIISGDNMNMGGNTQLSFSSNVLKAVQGLANLSMWAKVPGSWRDF